MTRLYDMLRAAVFPDFKGFDTLLIWGDNSDMERLSTGLLDVFRGNGSSFAISGGPGLTSVRVRSTPEEGFSAVSGVEDDVEWNCPPEVLQNCIYLIEPLLTSSQGHQYVDVRGGLVDQVMIAVNEYPDDLRR